MENKNQPIKKHPLYNRWHCMRQRCLYKSSTSYKYYGGRGITVCERWLDFKNFVSDMGLPPTKKHTIDRIDNTKGYEKDNCRWVTMAQQNRNKRNSGLCKNGHLLTKENSIQTQNGKGPARRCKKCYFAGKKSKKNE